MDSSNDSSEYTQEPALEVLSNPDLVKRILDNESKLFLRLVSKAFRLSVEYSVDTTKKDLVNEEDKKLLKYLIASENLRGIKFLIKDNLDFIESILPNKNRYAKKLILSDTQKTRFTRETR